MNDLIRRKDAIELCLEALNNMPSAEMESVVRTLDADHAVINGREYISLSRVNEMLAEEKARRESVPVSVGEWIEDTLQLTNGLSGYTVFRCNICGNVMIHKSKYCPACGCYMEK